jgi:predicted nucleotidyltransferase
MPFQSTQDKAQLPQSFSPVIAALRQGFGDNLVAVVLFGSRARGDATEVSDWDVLVIARQLSSSPLQRHSQLKMSLPVEWRGQVSLLSRTAAEFESHLSSLMLDIALDGVVLYDPQGYAAQRLAALQQLITNRGLYREQIGRDFIWKWKQFPGFRWSLEWKEVL